LQLSLLLEHFSNNINQFAYQYIAALDSRVKEVLAINDDLAEFYSSAFEFSEDCLDILIKHRSQKTKAVKLLSVYENIDNYLSWYTEQNILHLLVSH